MLLVVARDGKICYMKEFIGSGLGIKKSQDNKFQLCLDDRIEPIATYNTWEEANQTMDAIIQSYATSNRIVVISPNSKEVENGTEQK